LWSRRVLLQSSFRLLRQHSFFSEVTVQASAPHRGMSRVNVL
jgi:hypothetical protein